MKTFLDNLSNPVAVTEAIRQIIYACILFEIVKWTDAQTIGALSAVSAVIALFLRGTTVSTKSLDQKVDAQIAHRELAGTTGTGAGMVPPPARSGSAGTTGLGVLIALGLTASLVGCGAKLPPNTSAEATMAVRATQVLAGLRATLPGIKALVCAPGAPVTAVPTCLKAADASKVVVHIERAGAVGEQLAGALKAVDEAKDAASREAGLARAREFLTSIQGALSTAQVTPENEPARTALVQLFGNVTALLFAVGSF